MARVLYIGAPEAPAAGFATLVQATPAAAELACVDGREAALAHLSQRGAQVEAMIGHHFQFDDELLQLAPRLRWVQSLTTGTDQILRLKSLADDVIVSSTRGMHGPQMSELIFLHMLALARDFPRMQRNQQAATWERWPQPLLWGKTVTIVGVGAIAEALAPRCKAFGMTVVGVSATPRGVAGFDRVMVRGELVAAVSLADFVVLIVPLTPDTENLVDARVIAAMKPSAYLVNAARGGVLDEAALLAALRARRIAGAGLDVFRQQPLPPDSPWWREPQVIVTPLVGGMSDIYLQQAFPLVEVNLRLFLQGRLNELHNTVKRAARP
jgi:phosphoglycerate dehydrogenase-like enzyme